MNWIFLKTRNLHGPKRSDYGITKNRLIERRMNSGTRVMLLVVALLVEAQAAESTNILSRIRPPIHQDLSRAYGFCLGQSNSLSKIEREFPPFI